MVAIAIITADERIAVVPLGARAPHGLLVAYFMISFAFSIFDGLQARIAT
jgi:hypothetical protein